MQQRSTSLTMGLVSNWFCGFNPSSGIDSASRRKWGLIAYGIASSCYRVVLAVLILWAPGGFRFTCYYYRGAYYKAFWGDPPGCTVGEPRKSYLGERYFPLVLQNVHRYFLYIAIAFIAMLAYDAVMAFEFDGHFGIGVGSLVMTVNVVLLASYTFGCHSLRHLVGGGKDELSKAGGLGKACYDGCSKLNRKHMLFAWCSLFSVGLTDVYIRLCSMGIIHDFRIV